MTCFSCDRRFKQDPCGFLDGGAGQHGEGYRDRPICGRCAKKQRLAAARQAALELASINKVG